MFNELLRLELVIIVDVPNVEMDSKLWLVPYFVPNDTILYIL